MKYSILTLAILASAANAQLSQTNQCPPTATNCTGSNQNSGDTSTTVNNGDTHSSSSLLGNSSASNASGNNINPEFDNRAQTTQNANNTTTGTISGGNTTSGATGGAATGNLSTNDNKSSSTNDNRSAVGNTSASTGASNSGGNTLGSSSGGNTMTGGANSAAGGAGGAGGSVAGSGNSTAQGGAGGRSDANAAQQQGIAGSGNSRNSMTGGDQTTRVTGGDQNSNLTGGNQALRGGDQRTSQSTSQALRGGDQDASTRSGVGQSGNSSTYVGGDSYTNKTIFIPPIVPPTPPSQLAVGNIVKETTACGPLQTVVKTPINGVALGFFTDSEVKQGFTYDLQDYKDANGNLITYSELPLADGSGYRMIGHQAIIFGAIIGTSNAKNISLGGGGSGGGWGQGGGGNSGAIQQLVTNIQLRACDLGTVKFVREAKVVAPVAVPAPMPVIQTTRE